MDFMGQILKAAGFDPAAFMKQAEDIQRRAADVCRHFDGRLTAIEQRLAAIETALSLETPPDNIPSLPAIGQDRVIGGSADGQ